jgi:hypothetical protein
MVATPADRAAREAIRQRERAIWTDVERIGRELRTAEAPKQSMTQAERDSVAKKPTEGMSA